MYMCVYIYICVYVYITLHTVLPYLFYMSDRHERIQYIYICVYICIPRVKGALSA